VTAGDCRWNKSVLDEEKNMDRGIRHVRLAVIAILAMMLASACVLAQSIPTNLYDGMRWRLVGPFRGGRVEAAVGVPGDPLTYYFGAHLRDWRHRGSPVESQYPLCRHGRALLTE
jgi:hypothetical protein